MLRFILKRLFVMIPMSLLVVTLTWGLIRMAPGTFYSGEKKLPAAVEANIREKYGLDKPLLTQYLYMLGNVTCRAKSAADATANGVQLNVLGTGIKCLDFGDSLKYQGESVNEIILRHLPYSAAIGIIAYLVALSLGVSVGMFSALKQNSLFDHGAMSVALLGLSVPSFVLGPLLVVVFSHNLFLLPPARWGGVSNLVLPVVTLAAAYAAYIARLTRAGMLEVLRSDYIRTARAKGLDERTVLFKHALRGGIIPVVSFTGPALAALLAGTVVVEKIFAIPGLGNIFIQSIADRDEPLTLGIVAFISLMVMAFNLAVDIAYGVLDPRVRYE